MDGIKTIISLLGELVTFLWLFLRPQGSLADENLFLRKQLSMFQERKAKSNRPDTPIRIALVLLSRLCERLIGTLRRECLDFFIPLTESHLRSITKNRVSHYNKGQRHSSIGPGIPNPPSNLPVSPLLRRHRIPDHLKVVAHTILGGLHHEYGLMPTAV